jgi:hypothetical protein
MQLLEGLATAAAAAYDHLEADATRALVSKQAEVIRDFEQQLAMVSSTIQIDGRQKPPANMSIESA